MKRLPIMLAAGLAAVTALFVAAPASAAVAACGSTAPYLVNYEFTQVYAVTAIAKYNQFGGCGSGISNSDTAPVGPSLLTDIFPKTDPVTRAILFGVATDLPGDDVEGQQHLVLFTNDAFALSARNIAFGTLFPSTNEASLIVALLSLADGTSTDDDYSLIGSFAEGEALSGPNGDAGFGLGDTFTSIAFSDGRIIGNGRFFATPAVVDGVPEPATWAMLVIGFGAIGAIARRRGVRPAARRLTGA